MSAGGRLRGEIMRHGWAFRIRSESHRVAAAMPTTDGFAEVFPEHEFKIVRLLQRADHIAGMTGDG